MTIPTRTQLSLQRHALFSYRRNLHRAIHIAYWSGERQDMIDEIRLECKRLTANIQVLSSWILELDAAPVVAEAREIMGI